MRRPLHRTRPPSKAKPDNDETVDSGDKPVKASKKEVFEETLLPPTAASDRVSSPPGLSRRRDFLDAGKKSSGHSVKTVDLSGTKPPSKPVVVKPIVKETTPKPSTLKPIDPPVPPPATQETSSPQEPTSPSEVVPNAVSSNSSPNGKAAKTQKSNRQPRTEDPATRSRRRITYGIIIGSVVFVLVILVLFLAFWNPYQRSQAVKAMLAAKPEALDPILKKYWDLSGISGNMIRADILDPPEIPNALKIRVIQGALEASQGKTRLFLDTLIIAVQSTTTPADRVEALKVAKATFVNDTDYVRLEEKSVLLWGMCTDDPALAKATFQLLCQGKSSPVLEVSRKLVDKIQDAKTPEPIRQAAIAALPESITRDSFAITVNLLSGPYAQAVADSPGFAEALAANIRIQNLSFVVKLVDHPIKSVQALAFQALGQPSLSSALSSPEAQDSAAALRNAIKDQLTKETVQQRQIVFIKVIEAVINLRLDGLHKELLALAPVLTNNELRSKVGSALAIGLKAKTGEVDPRERQAAHMKDLIDACANDEQRPLIALTALHLSSAQLPHLYVLLKAMVANSTEIACLKAAQYLVGTVYNRPDLEKIPGESSSLWKTFLEKDEQDSKVLSEIRNYIDTNRAKAGGGRLGEATTTEDAKHFLEEAKKRKAQMIEWANGGRTTIAWTNQRILQMAEELNVLISQAGRIPIEDTKSSKTKAESEPTKQKEKNQDRPEGTGPAQTKPIQDLFK